MTVRYFRPIALFLGFAAVPISLSAPALAASCHPQELLLQRAQELHRSGQYLLSSIHFSQLSAQYCDTTLVPLALFGYALNMAELGETSEALRTLNSLGKHKNALLLRALVEPETATSLPDDESKNRFKLWTLRYSNQEFSTLLEGSPTFAPARRAELQNLNIELNQSPKKSPWLAAGASLLLPGAGQAYVGAYQSAAIALVLNALFLTTTVELARHDLPFAALAAGTVFSVTYVGNILNATDAARRLNENAQAPVNARIKSALFPELTI